MQSIDELAKVRGIETIYLHVDVKNEGAKALYERAGYSILPPQDYRYAQFTRSLNLHDGATKGRNHHLLSKDLRQATWLPDTNNDSSMSKYLEQKGTLGFEVTA